MSRQTVEFSITAAERLNETLNAFLEIDREGALRMLQSSISRLRGSLGNVEFDPDLASLRDDPRFQKMVAEAKKRLGVKERPTKE